MAVIAVTVSAGWPGYEWQNALARQPAHAIERGLPDQIFAVWLMDQVFAQLPNTAFDDANVQPCPEAPEDCMAIIVEIPSRARRLEMRFDRERFAFVEATISGPELERLPPITSLAELPKHLKRPLRPYPLACPRETELRLVEEHAGLLEWCETPEGIKHGPARAWFNTGLYLLHRGAWQYGEKIGEWFECDRFERCRRSFNPTSPRKRGQP